MNCCGQKRQSLQFTSTAETSLQEIETEHNMPIIDQKPVYFRYSGNSEFQVKGLFNIIYTFSAEKRQVLVHAADVSVMRGYDNLTEVSERNK